MIKFENPQGVVSISQEVISKIVGYTVTNCFGVVGMSSRSHADGFVTMFRKNNISHGVRIGVEEGALLIDVHIVVRYGININAITQSIIGKVKYNLQSMLSVKIKNVTVFVDNIAKEEA